MSRRASQTAMCRCLVLVLAVVGTFVASLLAAPIANASTYPPTGEILTVPESTVFPGEPVVATVTGGTPGETVTFFLEGNEPVTVVFGPDGTATTVLTAPPTPGEYELTAVLSESGVILSQTIIVAEELPITGGSDGSGSDPDGSGGDDGSVGAGVGGSGGGGTGSPLPSTGADGVSTMVLLGGSLVLLGGGFVLVTRQRRRDESAAVA